MESEDGHAIVFFMCEPPFRAKGPRLGTLCAFECHHTPSLTRTCLIIPPTHPRPWRKQRCDLQTNFYFSSHLVRSQRVLRHVSSDRPNNGQLLSVLSVLTSEFEIFAWQMFNLLMCFRHSQLHTQLTTYYIDRGSNSQYTTYRCR